MTYFRLRWAPASLFARWAYRSWHRGQEHRFFNIHKIFLAPSNLCLIRKEMFGHISTFTQIRNLMKATQAYPSWWEWINVSSRSSTIVFLFTKPDRNIHACMLVCMHAWMHVWTKAYIRALLIVARNWRGMLHQSHRKLKYSLLAPLFCNYFLCQSIHLTTRKLHFSTKIVFAGA